MIKKLLPAAALLMIAAQAQAVTYTAVNGAPDPGPGLGEFTLADFENPISSTVFTATGNYQITSGTTANAAAPASDATAYLYVSSALPTDNATLTASSGFRSLGFYWGSVDTYNSVDVLGSTNGGATTTLYTLKGSDFSMASGNQTSAMTNQRVTFTAGNGESITGLRFTSTGVAFEIDNVTGQLLSSGNTSAVPEPASWALLLAGFGVVGATARRRRSTTAVSA